MIINFKEVRYEVRSDELRFEIDFCEAYVFSLCYISDFKSSINA